METYDEVAWKIIPNNHVQRKRYVAYMRARWADTEAEKCEDGYAVEWAERFRLRIEYAMSDREGQHLLDSFAI